MAITGQLTVTPEQLQNQAGQVRTANKNLQDKFNRMKTLIMDTGNYWKGEAADAHRENYTKNQGKIDEIIARYDEHIRDLEAMAGVYREAETAAKNMADELPVINL